MRFPRYQRGRAAPPEKPVVRTKRRRTQLSRTCHERGRAAQTGHIVSEIDIQLWVREQRRRWFARTFRTPLRRFSPGVAGDVPPGGHGAALGVSFSLLPVEATATLSSVTHYDLAVARVRDGGNRSFGYAPDRLGAVGPTIDVDVDL